MASPSLIDPSSILVLGQIDSETAEKAMELSTDKSKKATASKSSSFHDELKLWTRNGETVSRLEALLLEKTVEKQTRKTTFQVNSSLTSPSSHNWTDPPARQ